MSTDGEERSNGAQQLTREVDKRARRIDQARRERQSILGQTVYLGVVGVMFVLPVVAGAYLGRWLDGLSEGYSVRWTLSLILLGVAVGAVNVYLFLRR